MMRFVIGVLLCGLLAGCQMDLPFGKAAGPKAATSVTAVGAGVGAGVTAAPGAIVGGPIVGGAVTAKPITPAPKAPNPNAAAQVTQPAAAKVAGAKAPDSGATIPAGTIPAKGTPPMTKPGAKPEAKPEAGAPPAKEPPAEEPASSEPKSAMQLACEKSRGTWRDTMGRGVKSCVFTTRDGGKSCRKESDCDGACLARSGTCAPIKPLFGCNDILQADGRQVTLCID